MTVVVVIIAVVGPAVSPYSPTTTVAAPFSAPNSQYLLGTDILGRDVLSRLLSGGWQLLLMALAATLLGVAGGALIGLTAGYKGGRSDSVIMRTMDVLLAFPQIVFALLLVSVLGAKLWLIVLAIALIHTPQVARVIRSASLDVCERDFVQATALFGMRPWRVISGELLPNVMSPLSVEFGLRMAYSIVIMAGLSFLGFGLQPPSPNWGTMLNENRIGLTSNPWAVVAPAVVLSLLTIGLNMLTDGIARANLGVDKTRTSDDTVAQVMLGEILDRDV